MPMPREEQSMNLTTYSASKHRISFISLGPSGPQLQPGRPLGPLVCLGAPSRASLTSGFVSSSLSVPHTTVTSTTLALPLQSSSSRESGGPLGMTQEEKDWARRILRSGLVNVSLPDNPFLSNNFRQVPSAHHVEPVCTWGIFCTVRRDGLNSFYNNPRILHKIISLLSNFLFSTMHCLQGVTYNTKFRFCLLKSKASLKY